MQENEVAPTAPDGLTVDFQNDDIADTGLHSGVICGLEDLGEKTIENRDAGYDSQATMRWMNIWVSLTDQSDVRGNPLKVRVELTQSGAIKSHLWNILVRLGFGSSKGGKFSLKNLIGTEVDVFVYHERGHNKNYRWAKVEPEDLTLRGKGRKRQVAVPIDDSIIVEPKWMRERTRGAR